MLGMPMIMPIPAAGEMLDVKSGLRPTTGGSSMASPRGDRDAPWYHGNITRVEAENRLRQDGVCCVRVCARASISLYECAALSVHRPRVVQYMHVRACMRTWYIRTRGCCAYACVFPFPARHARAMHWLHVRRSIQCSSTHARGARALKAHIVHTLSYTAPTCVRYTGYYCCSSALAGRHV